MAANCFLSWWCFSRDFGELRQINTKKADLRLIKDTGNLKRTHPRMIRQNAPCPLALECFFKINQRGSKGEWVQPVWVMGLSDQGDMRKSKGGWFHKKPKAIFFETSDIPRALFSFWSTDLFDPMTFWNTLKCRLTFLFNFYIFLAWAFSPKRATYQSNMWQIKLVGIS